MNINGISRDNILFCQISRNVWYLKRNRWIAVCIDHATRYCVAELLRSGTAPLVAKFLVDNVFLKHGVPTEILSDRGQVYKYALVTGIVNGLGGRQVYTTAYRPQVNGACEKLNGTLLAMITHFVNTTQNNWDSVLPHVVFAYNTAKQ